MKKALWFAIILLALGTAAFGGAVSGVSNPFGVDNTLGVPTPVPAGALNPYVVSNGNLLRGQIHAHYLDDFHKFPFTKQDSDAVTVAGKYRDLGYDFVSLTEHNVITPAPSVNGIMSTPYCEEVTTDPTLDYWGSRGPGHILALGMDSSAPVVPWDYTPNEIIPSILSQIVRTVHTNGGLAILAHPEWCELHTPQWLAYLWEKPEFVPQGSSIAPYPEGISIYSAPPPIRKDATELWDGILDRGVRTWGFAEDDYAPGVAVAQNCAGRTWVGVPSPAGTVTWTDIRSKLTTGNFYTYWMEGKPWPAGKTVPQISVNVISGDGGRPRISVTISGMEPFTPGYTPFLDFIGAKHWEGIIRTRRWAGYLPHDSTYEYQCNGNEGFIRVMVTLPYTFGTLKITSQPIVIYKTGNPYTQQMASKSGRTLLGATSAEFHLRYLEPQEKPSLHPPAGYVGDAFEVTTDTGTVPPGGTLNLSYEGADVSAMGGTQYLAIYRYDTGTSAWVKVGGAVDPGTQTIESAITALGKYCISADLPADTTAPQVFIDNPAYGATVASDTTVRATVNDDLGAWRVKFYMNDHLLAEDADGEDGWNAAIKIADYCTGDWTLKAEAEDLAGNTGTVETPIYIASATPRPTVTITSPASGGALTGTVTASGTCGDDVAVASVTIKMDDTVVGLADLDGSGGWTCDIDTGLLVNGVRTLKAVVEDYPGNEASASVSVTINNATASVAFSPGGGIYSAPQSVAITCATPDAVIHYTTNGVDPTESDPVVNGPVLVDGNMVLKARAFRTGWAASAVQTAEYTVVDYTVFLLSQTKRQANGVVASILGAVVTAVPGTGQFYVESDDRSCGIMVLRTGHGLSVGKRVDIVGTISTSGIGEKYVSATSITDRGSGVIEPLLLTNRDLGGADWCYDPSTKAGQKGLKNGTGLNNIGLLITTMGRVTYSATSYFYIDDGSALADNSGHIGIKVLGSVPKPSPLPPGWTAVGKYVKVTGISTCFKAASPSTDLYRQIWAREVVVVQ